MVDQFEEIFRYHHADTDAAAAFVSLLLESISNPNIYIVITMRSDFIGDAARFQNLPDAINDSLYLTPRLNRSQLKETIELPALVYGGKLEPLLVNHLLNEVGTDSDHLPLLEHSLMYQWSHDDDHILTLEEYQEYEGGLKNILNLHLESVYAALSEEKQKIVEVLFRALTERTSDHKYIRRLVKLDVIAGLADVKPEAVIEVVEIFRREGRNFLMPPPDVELNADSILDISHESLIRQWRRLKDWVKDEHQRTEIYQRLEAAAKRYDEGKGELYRGKDLENARECVQHESFNKLWADLAGDHYDEVMHFVNESEKERQRRYLKEKKQRLEKEKQKRQRRKIKVYSFAAGLVFSIVFAIWGWVYKEKAENLVIRLQHVVLADVARLSRDGKYTKAEELLKLQIPSSENPEIEHSRNLLQRLVQMKIAKPISTLWHKRFTVHSMSISPDGHWLIAGGLKGKLIVYDLKEDKVFKFIKSAHDRDINGIRFLSDSSRFVSIDNGQVIRANGKKNTISELKVWQLPSDNSSEIVMLKKLEINGRAKAIDVNYKGNIIAVGGTARRIELIYPDQNYSRWLIEKKHTKAISDGGLIFWSEREKLVSTSKDGVVRVTSLGQLVGSCSKEQSQIILNDDMTYTMSVPSRSKRLSGEVLGLAILPHKNWLAASSGININYLNVQDNNVITEKVMNIRGHDQLIFSLEVAKTEKGRGILVSASIDKTVRIWDAETGEPLRKLQGHEAALFSVVYDSQRKRLLSSGADRQLLAWSTDLPYQNSVSLLNKKLSAIAVNNDANRAVIGDKKGVLSLYRMDDYHLLHEVQTSLKSGVQSVVFQPKEKTLAIVGSDDEGNGVIEHWQYDDEGLTLLKSYRYEDTNIPTVLLSAAFSPNGKWLVFLAGDGKVGLIDLSEPIETRSVRYFKAHDMSFYTYRSSEYRPQIMFGNNSEWFISSNKTELKVWNIEKLLMDQESGHFVKEEQLLSPLSGDPNRYDINAENTKLVAVGPKGIIKLYSMNSSTGHLNKQESRKLQGQGGTLHVMNVAFCADGYTLATLAKDGLLRIWGTENDTGELAIIPVPSKFKDKYIALDLLYTGSEEGCTVTVPTERGLLSIYDFSHLSGNIEE